VAVQKQDRMIVDYIITAIQAVKADKAVLIAFDGVDTAGKTFMADMVHEAMRKRGLFSPIRVSIDKFHNPRYIRIQRGELSPEGFFYDSFNYKHIRENVIEPVKEEKDTIIPAAYDYKSETECEETRVTITGDTVILFDGIFMNRDELFEYWDVSIFLEVSFDTVMERAITRDSDYFGSEEIVRERYAKRYIPGEKLYLEKCEPHKRADIVIDNNDYRNPVIVKKFRCKTR
jgi:uridine kinase